MLICKKPKIFDVDLYALAALVGFCALTWLVLIKPLNEKVSQQHLDQEKQRLNKESAQTKLVNLRELTRQEQVLASKLKQTRNILGDHAAIPETIRNMERLCRLCGLRLDEINPGEDTSTQHFRKTGLHLRLSGTFPQGQTLLAQIREKMHYVRIKSMLVTMKDTRLNRCEIVIDLDIFSAR